MKTDIEKLVITQPTAQKLVEAGLMPCAMFHWWDQTEDVITHVEGEPRIWRCGLLYNPGPDSLPAWTYEEIRILLGNFYPGADLPEPRPKPMKDEDVTFYVYYPDTCKNHKSGAEASAQWLLFLIEEGRIKPEDANERYWRKFGDTPYMTTIGGQ
jgi:hypothetical protein